MSCLDTQESAAVAATSPASSDDELLHAYGSDDELDPEWSDDSDDEDAPAPVSFAVLEPSSPTASVSPSATAAPSVTSSPMTLRSTPSATSSPATIPEIPSGPKPDPQFRCGPFIPACINVTSAGHPLYVLKASKWLTDSLLSGVSTPTCRVSSTSSSIHHVDLISPTSKTPSSS